jgi:hypothetical protein
MTLYKGPHSLFRALAPKYRLNKAEYLQLYNLRPATQVMLELVIEEVRYLIHSCFHFHSHSALRSNVQNSITTIHWR